MSESFGARLRQQRERQHVALATIADKTKIKQSLLDALERDNVTQWPGGIFRRAFIRAYAQAIGLEPDAVVREFLEVYPDPGESLSSVSAAAAAEGVDASAGPPTRLRQLVGSAVGSLTRLRSGTTAQPGSKDTTRLGTSKPAPQPAPHAVTSPPDRRREHKPVASERRRRIPVPFETDLLAAAELCTEFGRARRTDDLSPLFLRATRLLGASGLIVWVWDPSSARLQPAWAHGYPDSVLSHLPVVARDAKNATAAAFRSAQLHSLAGNDRSRGALVVPLKSPHGCIGVLAIELQGRDAAGWVRAFATIFAAQLTRIVEESSQGPERFDGDLVGGDPGPHEGDRLTLAT